jgi:heme exporter protein A
MRLIVREVSAERGGRLVLSNVSFAASSGELVAVTGPNGAGKSTLLRLVAGLLTPASGELRLDPAPAGEPGEMMHYVGHRDALKRSFTIAEMLGFWQALSGGSSDIEAAIEAVGLGGLGHLPVSILSAGQGRRVALARLLVTERPVWLLDEPTSTLDAAAEALFGGLVAAHLARGGIAIAATHRPLPLAAAVTVPLGRPA